MQDEWKKRREMPPPFEGGPRATQDSSMDIEEVEQAVVLPVEVHRASSEAPSVASSMRKVSVMILRLTGLMTGQRGRAPGDEGVGGASGKNRHKVAVPLVYVGWENTCDACKTHGKADICTEGTGVACAECQRLKGHCSFAQGKRGAGKKAVEMEGSVEMTRCEYPTYPWFVATDEGDSRSTGLSDH